MDDPTGLMDVALDVLNETFKLGSFRGVQEKVIRRLLVENKSALVVMPTGGGKSLTYQLPALIFPGLTLVISPLLSLQKDQCDALRKLNIEAAEMNSSCSLEELSTIYQKLKSNTLKILYVAPERLNNESFVAQMKDYSGVISLIAIDEAHCISQWGSTFRPDYLKVARFAEEIEAERILCLTATAPPAVVKDIAYSFCIDPDEGIFKTGTYRSNLSLQITPCQTMSAKLSILVPWLKSRKSGAAIVYATTQWDAEKAVNALKDRGIESKCYHAGVEKNERKAIQDWFIKSNGVVVATIAFGMGIDKSDIRQIAHLMIPKTMENYSQEIGRAGRDGIPSECLMLPCPSDLPVLESFARGNTPSCGSIKLWLREVFATKPDEDGNLNLNLYDQAARFDIKQGTLGLLNAQLELQLELLRAITPFYSSFTIKPSSTRPALFNQVLSDTSPAAQAIKRFWKKGTIWYTIDILMIQEASGIPRTDLARAISRWEGGGLCESKATGLRSRFTLLKPLPTNPIEIDEIAVTLFEQMVEREEADVVRLGGMVDYVAAAECHAQGLAHYFGDVDSVPVTGCGQCGYCSTKVANVFTPMRNQAPNEISIKAVLTTCGVRDDARFLARLAFGISSPRITSLGLSKNPIFASCESAAFSDLVKRFEEECAKVGGKNLATLAPPKPAYVKREAPYTSTSSTAKKAKTSGRGGWSKK